MTSRIPIFLDAEALRDGKQEFVYWEPNNSMQHHCLLGGNSGSGKSTHAMLIFAKLWKYMPQSTRLYLLEAQMISNTYQNFPTPDITHAKSAPVGYNYLAKK